MRLKIHLVNVVIENQCDRILVRVFFLNLWMFLETVAGGALSLPGINELANVAFRTERILISTVTCFLCHEHIGFNQPVFWTMAENNK